MSDAVGVFRDVEHRAIEVIEHHDRRRSRAPPPRSTRDDRAVPSRRSRWAAHRPRRPVAFSPAQRLADPASQVAQFALVFASALADRSGPVAVPRSLRAPVSPSFLKESNVKAFVIVLATRHLLACGTKSKYWTVSSGRWRWCLATADPGIIEGSRSGEVAGHPEGGPAMGALRRERLKTLAATPARPGKHLNDGHRRQISQRPGPRPGDRPRAPAKCASSATPRSVPIEIGELVIENQQRRRRRHRRRRPWPRWSSRQVGRPVAFLSAWHGGGDHSKLFTAISSKWKPRSAEILPARQSTPTRRRARSSLDVAESLRIRRGTRSNRARVGRRVSGVSKRQG